ncbi:hypothetical protein SAMN05216281_10394 [Cryobacterium luteum]|nr:hypothetical protein SAMN05216281_10394 [Cryobacterium luteum]
MSSLAIASPSPLPLLMPFDEDLASSTRAKRSKTRSRKWAGMPWPSSATANTASPAYSQSVIVTVLPPCCAALSDELTAVVTVTTDTKEVANGITARVVRDTVFRGDSIIEDTFDWYAQDGQGAIWYLGEDTAEFENGAIVSTSGSFEAGVNGALPGIAIPADPAPGMKYRQEYYQGEAEDNGEILSIAEMVDVPLGHFDSVLLTKDTITIDPEVLEYKLYARDVGPVLTLDVSGGAGRAELVRMETVSDGSGTGPLGQPH